MADCLFCKMVSGEIETNVVYENDHVFAFRDIDPKAPTHVLVIPKQHISTLNDINDASIAGAILLAAQEIARSEGIAEDGYRAVINCNQMGGQAVYHLHLHVIGGRQMDWPPG